MRKNKERPRDFYAGPEIWNTIYECTFGELRDATDLAYLSGQRPADAHSMRAVDCEQLKSCKTQYGGAVTASMLRLRFDDARRAAINNASEGQEFGRADSPILAQIH